MIEKINLKNFQAHADTTLEFDKGVNIIVGRSDQGKSSIIRALRWVVENRPTGVAFRKYGAATASVTLTVDGKDITRTRGDKINSYTYSGEEYKALRSDVPTNIAEAINFGIANIQTQHEQYFLLQGSAGDAAKTINQIANLQIIGETVRNANSYVAAASRKAQSAEEVLAKANEDVAALEWTVPLMDRVRQVQELSNKIESARSEVSKLQSIIGAARVQADAIARNTAPLAAQKLAVLQHNATAYRAACHRVVVLSDRIEAAKALRQHTALHEVEFPHTLLAQVRERYEQIRALTSHIARAREAQQAQTVAQSQYVALRREQRSVEAQIPKCPTCGQVIRESGK